jgi:adenosylhomocysteinase
MAVVMANSGHFNVEINQEDLEGMSTNINNLKPDIDE